MSVTLIVQGLASGKVYELKVSDLDSQKTLMDFLMEHDIRIASSCSGEGVCKKCLVNETLISCQIKVGEFLERKIPVTVSYL